MLITVVINKEKNIIDQFEVKESPTVNIRALAENNKRNGIIKKKKKNNK